MRLLFCCEFYFPSVGGVQEVMRQIAERMVRQGHDVTVATTRLVERTFSEHNGVKIEQFGVTGNLVRGIQGEEERFCDFVKSFDGDAILIKAAQQWTFDALWPILDDIKMRKVFIPCGFSGLFEPTYVRYFEELPDILRKFDHLIFYAEHYRDVDFARQHGLQQITVLANGASEIEFLVARDPGFRARHGIPEDSAVLLTVGSVTGVKGHRELLEAFVRLKSSRHVTFIMNGNAPPAPVVAIQPVTDAGHQAVASIADVGRYSTEPAANDVPPGVFQRAINVFQSEGWRGIGNRVWIRLRSTAQDLANRLWWRWVRAAGVFRREGWLGIRVRITAKVARRLAASPFINWMPASIRAMANPMEFWKAEARRDPKRKLLLVTDFPREELVQAYMASDLFVFASNIEYSPLVLFETVAAGTPFLSVPVGNAEEIAAWTGGGIICPAPKDERGYTRVNPQRMAEAIAKALQDPERLAQLGQRGHETWKTHYTWDAIAKRYESILMGDVEERKGASL